MAGSSYDTYGSNSPYVDKYPGLETATSKGTYWKGTDGNVWVYGDQGTNNAGQWDANSDAYWSGQGYTGTTAPFTGVLGVNTNTNQTDQTSVNTGTGTGGSGTSTYSQADLDQLNQQIGYLQDIYNSIATRKQQGLTGIENSYNKEYSNATGQRSRAIEDLNTQQSDTEAGRDRAVNQVDTYARTLGDSVRRRLGMASGSDSSAYQFAAPNAVARDASGKRTGVEEDFAANFRNIDTTKKRAESDYEKLLQSLAEQKQQKTYGLESDLNDQRDQIQLKLADAEAERAKLRGGADVSAVMQPYIDQISQRRTAIDGLFNKYNPTFQKQEVKVNTPTLRDYIVNRTQINGGQQQSQYAPYDRVIKKDEEEQKLY